VTYLPASGNIAAGTTATLSAVATATADYYGQLTKTYTATYTKTTPPTPTTSKGYVQFLPFQACSSTRTSELDYLQIEGEAVGDDIPYNIGTEIKSGYVLSTWTNNRSSETGTS